MMLFAGMGETVDIECGHDGCDNSQEACNPIHIPNNDPDFHSEKCLEFVRSEGVPNLKCTMGKSDLREHTILFVPVNLL